MIQSFSYPNIFRLSDCHYMVNRITDEMLSLMWERMSDKQREEFEIVYGKDRAEEMFGAEVRHADHAAAFFCGTDMTCIMWTEWIRIGGFNDGKSVRVLGCVCSDFAIKHTINFVKHSKEVRTAFELMEPSGVHEIYVMITEDFKQSRNWAVKVCGFNECCLVNANGKKFVMCKHIIGED